MASAQTTANIGTAIANTVLNSADEDSPQGSVRYTTNGNYTLTQPTYDSSGVVTGTESRSIPRWKRTVSLTTKSQSIFDRQQDTQYEMSDWALLQTQRMKAVQSAPFSLTGLPPRADAPTLQDVDGSLPSPGIIRRSLTTRAEDVRQRALDALTARTDFLMGRDRDAMVVKLANQGIYPGSVAYMLEMAVFDQGLNDARSRDYLAAGQEGLRQFQIELQSGQFELQAQQQAFSQILMTMEFQNKAQLQRFQQLHAIADFVNVVRERAVQERVLERGQPVNEITALLHGGKIDMPQFAPFRAGHVDPTPVGQFVYQSAALDMQKWQVQVQQQQSMFGGILGLAGNLFSAGMGGGMFGGI